jgi:hypothetical protein
MALESTVLIRQIHHDILDNEAKPKKLLLIRLEASLSNLYGRIREFGQVFSPGQVSSSVANGNTGMPGKPR